MKNEPRIRVQITQNSEVPHNRFPQNEPFVVQSCCTGLTNCPERLLESKPTEKLDGYLGEICKLSNFMPCTLKGYSVCYKRLFL